MEKLLKMALKESDSAEILMIERKGNPISFYNYLSADILNRDLIELSLRIIRDGKIGVSKGSFAGDRKTFVEQAVLAAKYGPKVEFDFPSEPSTGKNMTFDPELVGMKLEKVFNDGRAIYDFVKRHYAEMPLNLYMDNERKKVSLINSKGKNESYEHTRYTICVMSMYRKSKEGINKEITQCKYFKFPESMILELIDEYKNSGREVKVPSKTMPVIFRTSATWSLLYRLIEGVKGSNYAKNITPLKEKINTQIFSDKVTVWDDPTMAAAPGSVPFDDEGVPTRKKVIVDNGVLKNFIFDLESGAKSGLGSSGNGFKKSMWTRGIEDNPIPCFTNMIMVPGAWDLKDMIQDMGEGIIVNDVIGFHSGNMLQGAYSMNVGIGFYVKDKKIQGRAIDTMVAGNVYEDFFAIKGLGKKLEYNPQAYTPDIYFEKISVSGTG
ncbi:MAG: hypothetical protein A2161_14955 [Candidatus Schekmanbacteria bacterium RBG_13_48_7]|uniref:Metalloprotease TldD/E C-terminal domain-containing protein n=1 Tax=Candidatus Schekmanbacteria bacterium RBG_13_48_7 TaxID=1817878 RepID=A0A1F7RXG3_9BACT|nr:MAG: hypothetical protein A2161_14955 [Candidatus Schekmanbacteria bacterium RBG_13_48_7]